jgi:predicted phage baseplate assembly protein
MSSGLVPPHSSARRAQLLEQLIVSLAATDPDTLPIKTRFLDDPTIALLDAWATVGDVLGFYLDRIAEEGYLSTATEPGSILALATMIGHRPRPGLAATVQLAFTMNTDPADKAVQLAPGLLCQSVPGPGEQPQTFESAGGIVGRPSWSVIKPKLDTPWTATTIQAAPELQVAGASSTLKPNDVILLHVAADADPVAVTVVSTTPDFKANLTTVSLQAPPPPAAAVSSPPAPTPSQITDALDALLAPDALAKPPASVPASVNHLARTADSIFTPDSDAIPRLFSALRPAVAPHLYSALDTTALGEPAVLGASTLQISAIPFGAQAPRKPVFDDSGRPAGAEYWPLGGTHTLTLTMSGADLTTALNEAVTALEQQVGDQAPKVNLVNRIVARFSSASPPAPDVAVRVACELADPGGDVLVSASGVIDVTGTPATWQPVTLVGLGTAALSIDQNSELMLTYTGTTEARVPTLNLSAILDPHTEAVAVTLDGTPVMTWEPTIKTTERGQVPPHRVSIGIVGQSTADQTLVVSIVTSLPLQDPNILQLDRTYDTLVPGTSVIIRNPPVSSTAPTGAASEGPLIANITSVKTVTTAGFGVTAKVTELELDRPWTNESAVDQSALAHVTISAQPAPLQLLPQPLGDADYPVSGTAIELDSLIAGMEPGRFIIVRGVRTDLPAGATVATGELAMVESITSGATGGDTTHSTLNLAQPLAYAYRRSTVQIFGNVVPARQGATLHEILGSGQPAVPHQTFTLASGPPLADPAAGSGGFQSTLTVTVDGVGYQEVDRFDAATPPRSFMTGTDARGATTITFAAPLPAGSGNVRASYRAGDGSQGNVRADQVTQLLTRPSGLASVTNPLPGDGGAAGDGPEDVRGATPIGLRGLGRVVTVQDCGDLASSWAGVGKALATPAQVAGMDGVLITIAGINPEPLPAGDGISAAIEAAISDEADPQLPVLVVPADLYLIVLQAGVVRDPLVDWDTTADAVRAALLAAFGYASRGLGQDVALSDLIAAAHDAPSVLSFAVQALALVPATVAPGNLAQRLPSLLAAAPPPVFTLQAAATEWGIVPPAGQPAPAAVAYLSDAAPDTLILREQTS